VKTQGLTFIGVHGIDLAEGIVLGTKTFSKVKTQDL
jgi:hypothetical protein